MQDLFEWAGGSVPGRDHRHAYKNSHDAWNVVSTPTALVAIVCDGCGSGEHSEVGAKLGAHLVVRQVLRWHHEQPELFRMNSIGLGLAKIRRSLLAQIQSLVDSMAIGFTEAIGEYFLFTVLGALVTREETFVFGAGDGLYDVNGLRMSIKAKNNAPDYLAYSLLGKAGVDPQLEVLWASRTAELKSLLLGSDGVADLAAAAELKIPGKEEKVGPLSRFWEDDRYFKNPFAIKHRLNLVNRDYKAIDYERKTVQEEHGPLADDTTLVVVRRRK